MALMAQCAHLSVSLGPPLPQLVKAGGPDPVANSKLGDLLKQAKDLGVPKDLLDRNIKRASDKSQVRPGWRRTLAATDLRWCVEASTAWALL